MSGQLHQWLCEPLTAEVRAAVGRLQRVPGVAHVALMPDVHLAHDVCIGTVVGTTATLLPAAIGGDVGCGVATLRCSATLQDLQPPGAAASVLERLAAAAPVHRHRHRLPWPEHLKVDRLSQGLRRLAQRDGAVQLGTVGRGNHFVEIQADEQDHLWIMAHSGSRAMGPAIQRHHTPSGTLATLPADGPRASSYLADLDWALDYAAANRQALLIAAARVLREVVGALPEPDTYVDCAHNFVRREEHAGRSLWVHRKGAIAAAEGQPGLIPGSMGTATYHVLGRGHPDALGSSSHGAGRRMSRTEARQRIGARQLKDQLRHVHARHRRDLVEEAPAAYRDIDAVMRAQRDLTRIVRRLRPVISHKG